MSREMSCNTGSADRDIITDLPMTLDRHRNSNALFSPEVLRNTTIWDLFYIGAVNYSRLSASGDRTDHVYEDRP